jgi:hypothetical protein
MTGEERAGMAIGTHAEQQEVEYGDLDGRPVGKDFDEFLLIGIGEFLGIRDELLINCVDLLGRDVDFAEKVFVAQLVV